MKINPEIEKLLNEHNISYTKGMMVLFCLYHGLPMTGDTEQFLYDTMMQINVVKIVERNYGPNNRIVWNMPFYIDGDNKVESEWSWVTNEYRPLFRDVAKDRAGSPSGCIKRMKSFFSTHPEVRKQDVIAAAKLYIDSITNPKYMQSADYFIIKGKGADTTSRLEQYLEMVKDSNKQVSKPKMM